MTEIIDLSQDIYDGMPVFTGVLLERGGEIPLRDPISRYYANPNKHPSVYCQIPLHLLDIRGIRTVTGEI